MDRGLSTVLTNIFNNHSAGATAAVAYSGCTELCIILFKYVNERNDYPCTAAAQRMAERNSTAIYIYFCCIKTHLLNVGNPDNRKSLIQFKIVYISYFQTGLY